MSECVLNSTGILVNGKLDKPAAIKRLTEKLTGDAEAIKVIQSVNARLSSSQFFQWHLVFILDCHGCYRLLREGGQFKESRVR
jgi:hypothetical protein